MNTTVAGIPGQDPTLPEIDIVLNGQTHHLVFDLNSIVLLQGKIGKNVLTDGVNLGDALHVRATLWAGLLLERPDWTEEDAGKLVTPFNFGYVAGRIVAALGAAQADPDPDAPPKEPTDPPTA